MEIQRNHLALVNRQTEQLLLAGLADQLEEHSTHLYDCVQISAHTPSENYQREAPMSWARKASLGALALSALASPSLLMTAPNEALIVVGIGGILGGTMLFCWSLEERADRERDWRHDTTQQIEEMKREASGLRAEAVQLHESTRELRLLCATTGGGPTCVDARDGIVTLGGVRLKQR